MRKLIMLGAVVLAVLAVSCDTLNIGNGLPGRGPVVGAITVPTGGFAQENGDFSVTWTSGQAPYTISWNFGGGADPNTVGPVAATSPNSQTVLFTNNAGGTFTVTVTVTDALGQTGSATASYTYGVLQNQPPTIDSVTGDGTGTITVTVSDPDGGNITISVTNPAGLTANQSSESVASGGSADFSFSAADLFDGGSGTTDITADDGAGGTDTASANIVVGGINLEADTLYAIPLQSTAGAGDTVTIVIATGVPANPFQFLNGCRVTAPTGWDYVDATYNVGATGGGAGDTDGFWTNMSPTMFLLPPDAFIVGTDIGGGLTGIDFNVTPVGGSDVTTDEGALFNFGGTFPAGNNTLGFQDVSGVSRTYYQDSNAAPDRFWGDITNNHAGVPNSIDVS